jgi:hypothetical protein
MIAAETGPGDITAPKEMINENIKIEVRPSVGSMDNPD